MVSLSFHKGVGCIWLWPFVLLSLLKDWAIAADFQLAPSKHILGVPIYNYESAPHHASHKDPIDWVVVLKPVQTDSFMKAMCSWRSAGNVTCMEKGNPSNGGIGFVSLRASETELKQVVAAHGHSMDFIEPDMQFVIDPEEAKSFSEVEHAAADDDDDVDDEGWHIMHPGEHPGENPGGSVNCGSHTVKSCKKCLKKGDLSCGGDCMMIDGSCVARTDGPGRGPPRRRSNSPPRRRSCSASAPTFPTTKTGLWGLQRIQSRSESTPLQANSWKDKDYQPQHNGEGVHVYVVDTGIRTSHVEFEGRAIPTLETYTGKTVVCDANDVRCAMDGHGHGTHCAGTVGGKTVGVAKAVTLHAVKVMDDRGAGGTSKILLALEWIAANGISPSIISMSLGAPGKSKAIKVAMDKVVAANIVPIVAAGNMKVNACEYSPAYIPEAITVGAIIADGLTMSTFYSNWGPCVDIWAPGGAGVGRGTYSYPVYSAYKGTDRTYHEMAGTSMATPHVSGVAAMMMQVDKGLGLPGEMSKALTMYGTKDILKKLRDSPNILLYATCFRKEDFPPRTTTTTSPPVPTSRRRSGKIRRRRRRSKSSRRRRSKSDRRRRRSDSRRRRRASSIQ